MFLNVERRFDVDGAGALDVSEDGAVQVHQQLLLTSLVRNKGNFDDNAGSALQVGETVWKTHKQ